MQAVPLASSILEILPARGTRQNEKKLTVDLFLKKSDSKECKTNLECRKIKCEANHNKNRQTRLILCGAVMDEVKREVCIYLFIIIYLTLFIHG